MPLNNAATPVASTKLMPTLFVPHGAGPCFFMDWNPPHAWDAMAAYLKGIAAQLPEAPKAILMVSAHWLEEDFVLTSGAQPQLIYDYYGFPPHTYELQYRTPGEPELAAKAAALLEQAGLQSRLVLSRGFDPCVLIPLERMFPAARITMLELSVRRDLDPLAHLEAGRAVAALREEGVLIVGSGLSFHIMRGYGDARFTP